jgi:simple sugar transport system permease protein
MTDLVVQITVLADMTIRLSVVLLFACLAGLWSERAGVFDIGLEGKMLVSAFLSAVVAYHSGSVWVGMAAGCAGAVALSLLHGLAAITYRGDQLISGVAINFLASGLTVVAGHAWYQKGGLTPTLSGAARFSDITLPFAEALARVPLLGPVWSGLVSGQKAPVYLALALVPLSWWGLYRTRFGLRLRAAGENPAAVDAAGVSVVRLRYAAVMITGILCGLAGAYMATALQAGFGKEMTAGRGYIALAALIFAKWRPWGALWACLLFGLLEAVSNLYPTIPLGPVTVPVQFTQALPYVLTVVILAGFVGRAVPPKAAGEPFARDG